MTILPLLLLLLAGSGCAALIYEIVSINAVISHGWASRATSESR